MALHRIGFSFVVILLVSGLLLGEGPEAPKIEATGEQQLRDPGFEAFSRGEFYDAYLILRPWLREHPDDGMARLIASACAVRLQRLNEAEELLRGLPPEDLRVVLLTSELHMARGQMQEGIEILEEHFGSHPPALDGELRRLLGRGYVATRRERDAIELLQGHTAKSESLSLILAEAYFQLGELSAAIEILSAFDSLSDKAAGEMGRYLLMSGRSAEALPLLRRAVEHDPRHQPSWLSLSQALLATGETEQAKAAGQEAQKLANENQGVDTQYLENPIAKRLRDARNLRQSENYEQASKIVREGLVLHPESGELWLEEARNLHLLGRFEQARRAADAAVRLVPERGDAWYQRGLVLMALQETDAAEADLRRAIEANAKHPGARNQLAVLLARSDRAQEAALLLRAILSEDPDDALAKENLEVLLKQDPDARR